MDWQTTNSTQISCPHTKKKQRLVNTAPNSTPPFETIVLAAAHIELKIRFDFNAAGEMDHQLEVL